MKNKIIVIGGGHAGIEAVLACARMGLKTTLITLSKDKIGHMPCNTSIGGPAKGIVVREIDALGGQMAKTTDLSFLQLKILNTKKGPAIQSLRAQVDKSIYPKIMQKTIENEKNINIIEDKVLDLIIKDNEIKGVITEKNKEILASKVIITAGTYFRSLIIKGNQRKVEGPDGQKTVFSISESLIKNGFKLRKFKTGTPARIDKNSIDFSNLQKEYGHDNLSFSFYSKEKNLKNIPCHLTYTNNEIHNIIKEHIHENPLIEKDINGPRYCPSIEDKVYKFPDKEKHQIFLEPETIDGNSIYVQGMSTSFSEEIQEKFLRKVKGLENCKILKYGYAIEYDVIDPLFLEKTLESKIIKSLYFAGQINGTSGYEEAAAQGLIAGINAALSFLNKEPLILKRSNSYIGTLIDDLTTKGTNEPYRLLTSRSEYRLLLRSDNADQRLSKIGYKIGLLNKDDYKIFINKQKEIKKLDDFINNNEINIDKISKKSFKKKKLKIKEAIKREDILLADILKFLNNDSFSKEAINDIEIKYKYDGYIKSLKKQIQKQEKYEKIIIPKNFDYLKIHNMAKEAKEKLMMIKPKNIDQAKRIPGVNPVDIAVLLNELRENV